MRGAARGLLTTICAVVLAVLPAPAHAAVPAHAAPAHAAVPAHTAPAPAGSVAAAASSQTAVAGVADRGGSGQDSWRAALRVPRPPQSLTHLLPVMLPPLTLVTGLVLLLLTTRRAAMRRPVVAPHRLRAVRGPPAPIAR